MTADVHDDMRAAAALLATTACGDRRLQAVVLGADLDADRLAGIAASWPSGSPTCSAGPAPARA